MKSHRCQFTGKDGLVISIPVDITINSDCCRETARASCHWIFR